MSNTTASLRRKISSAGDLQPVVRTMKALAGSEVLLEQNVSRFPGTRAVQCAEPLRLGEAATLGPSVCAVVMSHHFERDLHYLHALLASEVRYIGLLGPRSRAERMLAERRARLGDDHPDHRR